VNSIERKPAEVIKAKKEAEKAMWKEFHHHFTQKHRDRSQRTNHHDFIDLSHVNVVKDQFGRLSLGRHGFQRETYFSEASGIVQPFAQGGPADTMFSGPQERLQNKLQTLNSMKQRAI